MILVDRRAGSGEYLDILKPRMNNQVRLATLDSADFMFEGSGPEGTVSVGLELKTLSDMLASMRSGRYIDQMRRMKMDYEYCYLLIQGSYAPSDNGFIQTPARGGWGILNLMSRDQKHAGGSRDPFIYSELDKFLSSLEVIENIIVRKASTKLDAAQQIVDLYTWWQKDFAAHASTKSVKLQAENMIYKRASVLRMVAAQLPGIGWGRSKDVAKKFRTTENMALALPSEWESIGGIGKVTALRAWKSIRTDEE